MIIRTIRKGDDVAIAHIIRNTLEEFGANHQGTVYYDESIWHLSDIMCGERMTYFVIEDEDKKIIGGAGVYPTAGLPGDVAELVKLYTLPEARGKGYGKRLIEECLNYATDAGYKILYLESMAELSNAVTLYEKMGFVRIAEPIGNSGHSYCKIWMTKDL